jgi:integrase
MPATSNKLNAAKVKNISTAGMYGDGGGLYLQVSNAKAGTGVSKSWIFRFKRNGKERQMGLGSLGTISLADAREAAEKARKLLLDGKDPIDQREAARTAQSVTKAKTISFEAAAQRYMAAHEAGWRNAQHRTQWTNSLSAHVYPVIGSLSVNEIDAGLVMQVVAPIWATRNETANRVRGRIESILDWAKVNGYRNGDNPARFKGHLQYNLAAKKKVRTRRKQPALPYDRMAEFMRELRQQPGIAPLALQFAILCASRSNEVLWMRWEEVDWTAQVWTIPGGKKGRTKNEQIHKVVLTPPALEILEQMKVQRCGDFVFPGEGGDVPLSNMSMTMLIRRWNKQRRKDGLEPWIDPEQSGRGVVPHGFRATFRTWSQEMTDFPDWLCEAALGHSNGDKVEAAYKRGSAMAKRKLMMDAWAAHCNGTAAADNVVPLVRNAAV